MLTRASQIEQVCLDDLVPQGHPYRRFAQLFDMKVIEPELASLTRGTGRTGYGIIRLFHCLLYPFMEDLSDRELEQALLSNTVAKWFCGFDLKEKTPDHSVFGQVRMRIGTARLGRLFGRLRDQLRSQGYMSDVFTFVDASHLIAKARLWAERDKAIKAKYDRLNNEVLPKVAHDKHARIGCKGNGKYWYGYKKHVSVDMPSGLIKKVAVTPANVTDAKGFRHIAPTQGAVYADKGYCTRPARVVSQYKGLHLAAIKRKGMRGKCVELDRFYAMLRSPYERVFSQARKRVRYVGVVKNQFAELFYAIGFNIRRLAVIAPP